MEGINLMKIGKEVNLMKIKELKYLVQNAKPQILIMFNLIFIEYDPITIMEMDENFLFLLWCARPV